MVLIRNRIIYYYLIFIPLFFQAQTMALPAFPGAEGFGALSMGGRFGEVIFVTNLKTSGFGSLDSALSINHPRYIIFRVSGVIDGIMHINFGNVTIAGQTSPGGITVKGILSNSSQDPNFGNIIMQHIRSRPNGSHIDDAVRVTHARNVIIDHCSFARATDECIQITYDSNYTIQNCIFTETLGEHYDRGGMLVKYPSDSFPNNNISIHHNMWNRIHGRMPLVSCDDTKSNNRCNGGFLNIEMSCNLMWDAGQPIAIQSQWLDLTSMDYRYYLNAVNNQYHVRSSFNQGMFNGINHPESRLFLYNNRMNLYPNYYDYQLVFCCNNFPSKAPADSASIPGTHLKIRNDFPTITYTHVDSIYDYMEDNVGAFPRDSMDRRLIKYVALRTIDTTPKNVIGENSNFDDAYYIDRKISPLSLRDGDGDGMPDYWEEHNGLDLKRKDHNDTTLSMKYMLREGYTNLECYLYALNDSLVNGVLTVKGPYIGSAKVFQRKNNCTQKNAMKEINRVDVFDLQGNLLYTSRTPVYFRELIKKNIYTQLKKGFYIFRYESTQGERISNSYIWVD